MEYGNQIKLTERKRQTGASKEICAKFFGNHDSVLIVQDKIYKDLQWVNNFTGCTPLIKERIIFKGSEKYEEFLNKYNTWYLDVCSEELTKEILLKAFEQNKTLIGHYQNRKEIKDSNEKFFTNL